MFQASGRPASDKRRASCLVGVVPTERMRTSQLLTCGPKISAVGTQRGCDRREPPHNNELQRTSDGNAAGSPLNSVFAGRQTGTHGHE